MTDADIIRQLEARIDVLESREAIADLICRYTEAIRARSPSRVAELMVEDAVVELRHADPDDPGRSEVLTRFTGLDEIRGSFQVQAGNETWVCPMVHNLRIEVDGDAARATCVLVSALWPQGGQYVGEYRDTFRRAGGVWRFASRTHVGFGDTTGQTSHQAYAKFQAARATASA